MARPRRDIPWLDIRGTTYYAYWYDEAKRSTEKLSLRTSDPVAAQRAFALFLTEGKAAFAREEGLTVEQALDQYYREHAARECVSLVTVEINIRHLKAFFKQKLLKTIDAEDCIDYADEREVAPSTIAKELSTLKAAAWHANSRRRLSLADMPAIRLPKCPISRGVWLFKDELELLMRAAATITGEIIPLRTLSFIELLYFTSSRRRAVETLSWPQVDIGRRRIALAKRGEKETKKRRPTIPADPLLIPTLERLDDQKFNQWVLGSDGRMDYWFDLAVKIAQLEVLPEREGRPSAKPTPHMVRHSRATHLLQDGKPLWPVAGLLGNTPTTVQSIYGHHTPLHTKSLFETTPR